MILTKDNLLRFVREKGYVTPTTVAENFETSTMIASAALSEISREKKISITYIKAGSSPYYYDILNKQKLIELGEKHLSGNDKEMFYLLKDKILLNDNSLTIPQKVAIEKLKDFAISLSIEYSGKNYDFWVWYLEDIQKIRNQILDYLKGNSSGSELPKKQIEKPNSPKKEEKQESSLKQNSNPRQNNSVQYPEKKINSKEETPVENLIENYFSRNSFTIESKDKSHDFISYNLTTNLNNFKLHFDARYYKKKPSLPVLLSFYSSSVNPKIVFIEKPPKNIKKISLELNNFYVVDIN